MDTTCRTCSRNDEFQGTSVNSISESHQEPIYLMLIYCTQLQFSTNDSLPQHICPECLVLLDGAFTFWKQCRQTDDNFRLGLTPAVPATKMVPSIEQEAAMSADKIAEAGMLHCCFPKCSKMGTSLVELEEHAKQDHWLKRRGFELKRKRNQVRVCSVCLAGFGTLASWEAHQLVLHGLCGKDSVKELGEQDESSDSDEWPEQEATEESFDHDRMELDSEEPSNNRGKRKSNLSSRGAGAGGHILFCNGCGYQSNKKFNMSRHQHIWGHEGITSTMPEMPTDDPPAELDQPVASASDNLIHFVEVPVKLEPAPNEPDDDEMLHEADDDDKSQQQCAYCGMVFYSKSQKLRHLQFNCTALYKPKKSSPKQCPDCNKKFNSKHGLARHVVFCSMGGEKTKSCPTCERVFNKTSNLKRHMSLKNCTKKMFQCQHCRASYSKMSALTRHLNNGCVGDIGNESPPERVPPSRQQRDSIVGSGGGVECPHCFSRLSRPGNLKRHINESCHVLLKKRAAAEATTEPEQLEEQEEIVPEVGEENVEVNEEIFAETGELAL